MFAYYILQITEMLIAQQITAVWYKSNDFTEEKKTCWFGHNEKKKENESEFEVKANYNWISI